MQVGLYAILSAKSLYFAEGQVSHYTTLHFMAYFWSIFFAIMGGGRGRNCFFSGGSLGDGKSEISLANCLAGALHGRVG